MIQTPELALFLYQGIRGADFPAQAIRQVIADPSVMETAAVLFSSLVPREDSDGSPDSWDDLPTLENFFSDN